MDEATTRLRLSAARSAMRQRAAEWTTAGMTSTRGMVRRLPRLAWPSDHEVSGVDRFETWAAMRRHVAKIYQPGDTIVWLAPGGLPDVGKPVFFLGHESAGSPLAVSVADAVNAPLEWLDAPEIGREHLSLLPPTMLN